MVGEQLDVIVESVLPRYGMELNGVLPLDERTLFVDTDRGVKRLRIDTDELKVKLRHALWEHLAKQGFRRVPRHIRTLYGDAVIRHGNLIFTLSDNWEGRTPDLYPLDLRLAGRNLARLHQASKGLQLEERLALPKRHGAWLDRFTKAGDELEARYHAWSELRDKNPLQERFLAHYDWIAEQIGRAVEGLSAGKYAELARRAEADGQFAVGDYRLSDLRIDEQGRVATLHIDDAIADLPLYDAAKFAHGLLERGEQEMARVFLDAYGEAMQMTQQEIVVLDAYLTFPHAAYRHLTQFQRLKRGAEVFAQRLEQAVASGLKRRPMVYGADGARWM
jgi:CotS family spore coat protein